jgi:hypothetical protein
VRAVADAFALDWDELLEHVERAAAAGDPGAARLMDVLLTHEADGGDTASLVLRFAARRFTEGARAA